MSKKKKQENEEIADAQEVLEEGTEIDTAVVDEEQGEEEIGTEDAAEESETDAKVLQQQIAYLKQQLDEQSDKALLIQADMENLRKRAIRDVKNAHKYALDKFMKELLPVIDSLELGISASDSVENTESLKEGMDLILKKFLDTLEKFEVNVVDPMSEKFNPEKHQAVTMQESEGSDSGTVLAVMQKGYELNGRLVRPAMVVVAK